PSIPNGSWQLNKERGLLRALELEI
ncbi:MAG: hypothetical protein ACI9H1_001598, partial [Polaribacter sp.]